VNAAFKLTFCCVPNAWCRYATLQEALKSHQFRVLDVIDEEGNVLLQLEHEVLFSLDQRYRHYCPCPFLSS
jgi:hypothetical protein